MKQSANLDLLRSVAVLAVLAGHTKQYRGIGQGFLWPGDADVLHLIARYAYGITLSTSRCRGWCLSAWARFP